MNSIDPTLGIAPEDEHNLALVANAHQVPFYVAAPSSTIDLTLPDGDTIPIEQRGPDEITHVDRCQVTPNDTPVLNFAFDITPAKYITAIITELGLAYPPFEESLARLIARPSAQP